ncbi:hypothetical protein VaNZ11_011706 [Volvox africanus]|uniref:Uncharacterized protein n=1 Tax=Volvox africanus TaxID=51714 RepID=A0ABQ5SDJ2_9CHLO|nr:hypothetical protein VaNZ11_011706 [Volvox africanus]
MNSNGHLMWPVSRLATIQNEETGMKTDVTMIAAEHLQAAQYRADDIAQSMRSMSTPQRRTRVILEPFEVQREVIGSRVAIHTRRSSAPSAATMRLAVQCHELEGNLQDDVNPEAQALGLGAEEAVALQAQLFGRSSGTVGTTRLVIPRERRRSSWAPGTLLAMQSGSRPGGHEALSPEDLYRQFITIRDAVLRKGQTHGKRSEEVEGTQSAVRSKLPYRHTPQSRGMSMDGEHAPGGAGDGPAGGCPLGSQAQRPASAGCDRTVMLAVDEAATLTAATSSTASPPASPYKSAVAIAAYAACAGTESPGAFRGVAEASASCGLSGTARPVGVQSAGGKVVHQRPPIQSPDLIDLQAYYYSPAASSSGADQQMSPLKAAVATNASDNVSYNSLYGCNRSNDSTQLRNQSTQGGGAGRFDFSLVRATGTMEAVSSIPETDSLFTLQPSGEAQPSTLSLGNAASCQVQQQERSSQPLESQSSAWQVRMAVKADMPVAATQTRQNGTAPGIAREPVATANSTVRLSSTHCLEGSAGRSGVVMSDSVAGAAENKGADMVVRSGRDGKEAFTPDYLRAVQSAAQRTLLPLPRVQSSSSIRSGGACGQDSSILSSGWAAVAAAYNSAAMQRKPAAASAISDGEDRSTYEGYVTLPLPGLPPPLPVPIGMGVSALPPPLAMHASPSVAAATAAVVTRCLYKGFPFAVIPAKHYAAMLTAAEQHDGPLVFHIVSKHCVYYPGIGRHAASSGGGPSLGEPACNGNADASSGCPRPTASSTQSKAAASLAASTAASCVRQLLAEGDALHVMSPGEYQRIQLAAQYSLRQLQDILGVQPSVATVSGSDSRSSASAEPDPGPLPPGGPGGRLVRQHRRGSSICSESNFSATVVRFNSGLEDTATTDAAGMLTRRGHMSNLATAQDVGPPLHPAIRVKALIQAAQLGNIARVAFLLKHGVDVNAVEQQQQQQHGNPHGVRGVLAGAFTVGGAAGGRTALHYAALAGSFGVAQLLLYHGAFAGVRDGTGRTAYDLARRKGHDAVAQLLKDVLERRRDVVRGCAASETRATAVAVAPRPGHPPPVPPRTKQLRSSSAPASGGAIDGAASVAGVPNALQAADVRTGLLAPAEACGRAGAAPSVSQPLSSIIDVVRTSPVTCGDCAAHVAQSKPDMGSLTAAAGLDSTANDDVSVVQTSTGRSKEAASEVSNAQGRSLIDVVEQLQTARTVEAVTFNQGARGTKEGTRQTRRNGGLFACFFCNA